MQTPYLQQEEVVQLLQSIPEQRDRLLAQFLYESGCSVSELTALRPAAVHTDGTVTIGNRTAHISVELARTLLSAAGTFVFGSRQAQTITAKRVQQILRPHLSAFKKSKPTPHVLRYSHIIHAYALGISLATISKQTGLGTQRLAQIVSNTTTPTPYRALFSGGRP